MSCRLVLICHGATAATRQVRFARDEPLEAPALHRASLLSSGRIDAAWTAPARAAIQTANAMRLDATIEQGLRDLDVGAWAGRTLAEVSLADPAGLERWATDPAASAPGGECVHDVRDRVRAWLDSLPHAGRVAAVTHAAVIRATLLVALEAPSTSFWRIDVSPLSRVTLQGRPGRWTLCSD